MQSRGFPVEWLSELKRKSDIVSVASNYLQLTQKGSRFWAVCPFHGDKNPSLAFNAEDGIYYCFGCKESGDVIKFIEKMENVDFMDAVKLLADKAGMQIPEMQGIKKQSKELKDRILSALDYAYKHYYENLYNKDAKVAQDYIKLRKLTRRELEDFKIGFSKNRTDIIDYLSSKGFTEKEMLDAGIIAKKDGKIFDAVAGRLVFPIFNSFGECIGFSARALEKTDYAKYKNTAETLVFQKGRVVFGINLLKAQKQQQLLDKVILVEGQMDVIAMHKAGFKQTVACMGTALTADHVRELKRYNENIYLCFDGDEAGTKATLRAIEMFRHENVNLKVVILQGGKDPDEVLQNLGQDKLQEMIDNAKPYMDYLIDLFKSRHNLDVAEEKNKFVKEILSEIRKLDSPTLFEPYLEKVRDITNIPIDVLRRDVNAKSAQTPPKMQEKHSVTPTENGDEKAAKFILASMLHKKDYVAPQIDYQKLLDDFASYLEIINSSQTLSSVFDIEGASEDKFLMEIVNFNFMEFQSSDKYFMECLWKIAEAKLKKMQSALNDEFKNCEDTQKRMDIAKKLGKLAIQLKNKSLEEFNVRR